MKFNFKNLKQILEIISALASSFIIKIIFRSSINCNFMLKAYKKKIKKMTKKSKY